MTKDNGPSAYQDGGAGATDGWIFVGGGRNSAGSFSGSAHNIEHAMLANGGGLSTSFSDPGGLSDGDGMQMQIANGYAYAFHGGSVNGGGSVVYRSQTNQSPLAIVGTTTVTLGTTWPSAGANLSTKVGRHGVVEESAFFYAVGGTSDDSDALASVYRILH